MKSIFKFAAMAFAAVALFASCDNKDTKSEASASIDGKVLKVASEIMSGMDIYLDFGKFAEGRITMGMDLEMYGMPGVYGAINDLGSYVITPTNATSGVITRTVDNGNGTTSSQDIAYSELTNTSCKIDLLIISSPEGVVKGDFVDVTLVDPYAE